MSSVLIWSVESVLLGLWALVLSSYSTPLHVFIARSHVLISSFTLALHLYIQARGLVVGSAVAQAFVCAVTALFLVYFVIVFGVDTKNNTRYFNMPSVGILTLDACIGLGWFAAAMISSIGMAFSFTRKTLEQSEDVLPEAAHTTSLMLHSHGLHLVVVAPCLVLAFMSGYEWTLLLVGVVAWLVYVCSLVLLIFMSVDSDTDWTIKKDVRGVAVVYSGVFLIAVPSTVIVLLSDGLSFQQFVLVVCLLVSTVLCSVHFLSFILKNIPFVPVDLSSFPSVDGFFGKRKEPHQAYNSDTNYTSGNVLNIPATDGPPPPFNPGANASKGSKFTYEPQPIQRPPRLSLAASLTDPAAVALNRRYLVVGADSSRDKAV
jgi:hypothetical protein